MSSPAEESSVSKGGSSSTKPLDMSAEEESALRASALGVGPPSGGAESGGHDVTAQWSHALLLWSPPHFEQMCLKEHGFWEQGLPSFQA